jgi:hypothetical protein
VSFLDNVLSGIARELKTLSGVVDVSQSPAPVPGQVLTAIDATHAHWADPTGGGGGGGGYIIADALSNASGPDGIYVDVSGSPVPTAGQVLLAVGEDAASWSDPQWLPLDMFDTANTVLCALDGDGGLGPVPVVMPPSTALMRAATGDIFAGTGADLAALIGSVSGTDSVARAAAAAAQATADAAVPSALFDANTVLTADADNTPHALAAAPSTILLRGASGNIKWGTAAEAKALLGLTDNVNPVWDPPATPNADDEEFVTDTFASGVFTVVNESALGVPLTRAGNVDPATAPAAGTYRSTLVRGSLLFQGPAGVTCLIYKPIVPATTAELWMSGQTAIFNPPATNEVYLRMALSLKTGGLPDLNNRILLGWATGAARFEQSITVGGSATTDTFTGDMYVFLFPGAMARLGPPPAVGTNNAMFTRDGIQNMFTPRAGFGTGMAYCGWRYNSTLGGIVAFHFIRRKPGALATIYG